MLLIKRVFSASMHIFGVVPFVVTDDYKLEQVQVLLRHGDRIADKNEIYDTDPYKSVFEKHGYGQLTDIGKQRVRKVGQILMQRYEFFLGDYKPEDVYAYSSAVNRTKVSLKYFLSGLYPSIFETPLSDDVESSVIPIHYEKLEKSFFTTFARPAYLNAVDKVRGSSEVLEKLEKYNDFRYFLKDKIGINQDNCFSTVSIYHNICSALSLGLPLPDWCSQADFEKLKDIAEIFFTSMSLTGVMKKLLVGPTIEQIIENMKTKQSKLFIYSGHDVNLSGFLKAHNFINVPNLCEFASAIVLEKLKGQDDQIYVRFFMWTGVSENWIPMKLPGCDDIFPLSKYEEIVEPILSTNLDGCECDTTTIEFPLANRSS